MSHSRAALLLRYGCIVVLALLAAVLQGWPTAGAKGYAVRAKRELILGQDLITTRNAAFLRQGLLRMSHRFCAPEELAAGSAEALALYGQACPAPDEAKLRGDVAPSTALMPAGGDEIPEGVTVVSLVCQSHHLFDSKHGIVTNPQEMGRQSERPAWMSARLGDKLLVESPVGLRVHGGSSRASPHKSFSLVFRECYGGFDNAPAGLFFGPDTPAANHVVLMNAQHPSRFNAALATEIATVLGCNTSRLTPAVVYLNGTRINSPFFLYQHQSPDFVKQRFSLEDVDWVRLKANRERENAAYVKWRQWIRKERFPTLLSDEARHYDIADLSAWALAISFTSAADNNQGGYFRDRSRPGAPWRSLVWDLDCAFTDEPQASGHGPYMDANDPIKTLLGDRARLFLRLMERAPEYREEYRKFVHEALTTRLPKEKLLAMAERYERLAHAYPMASEELKQVMARTREFLETRHEFYFAYLEKSLREFEAAGLAVEAAAGGG